jgi:hypothetical protein
MIPVCDQTVAVIPRDGKWKVELAALAANAEPRGLVIAIPGMFATRSIQAVDAKARRTLAHRQEMPDRWQPELALDRA